MSARRITVLTLWPVSGLLVVAGWIVFVRSGEMFDYSGGQAVFLSMIALTAPAVSTGMLRRHPDEWTGPLLGVCVVAAVLGAIRMGPLGPLSELAGTVALVTALLPAVVALNSPAFAGAGRGARLLARCWWASVLLASALGVVAVRAEAVPAYLWDRPPAGPGGTALLTSLLLYAAVVLTGLVTTIVTTTSRYRAMPHGGRPALRPIVVPLVGWSVVAAASVIWTVVGSLTDPGTRVNPLRTTALYTMLPALLVVALAAGLWWIDVMVRQPPRSTTGGRVAHRLRAYGEETEVERYLSRALADPSIRVLYPASTRGRASNGGLDRDWVDSRGRPARLKSTSPADRAVTVIRRDDVVIGLIEQDAAAAARPDAVELVATGAGLIMETERLTAAARRDLEHSHHLASRLLTASDEPRADLRVALLAGPLRELESVIDELSAGRRPADVVPRLTSAAAQVRTLSHGLFPSALTTGGLRAALPAVDTPARRFPPAVEMTAYLAAQVDPAAVVTEGGRSGRSVLDIRMTVPPVGGLIDRVTALGGEIEAPSPSVPAAQQGWLLAVPVEG